MTEYLLPAALSTATALYLDGRFHLSYDLQLVRSLIRLRRHEKRITQSDTNNTFYEFESKCREVPDNTFLIYEGRRWTYRQAYDVVLKHARWLKDDLGAKPSQIVAMDFTNKPEYIWLWFAMWSLGVKPAFLNCNLTGRPLVHSVKTSTSTTLLLDEEMQHQVTDEVRKELDGVDIKVFTADLEGHIQGLKPLREDDSTRGGALATDMALLIYTSGTTGMPKAAVVPWHRVTGAMVFPCNLLSLKPTDVFHTPMPLYHSSASLLGLCNIMHAGGAFSLSHRFSPRTFWPEVAAHNATIIQYVGETLRYLLTASPSPQEKSHKVRMAFGNGLRPDVWNKVKNRFGIETITEFYAATEGVGGTWNVSRNDHSAGSIGRVGAILRTTFRGASELIELDINTEEPVRDTKTGLCKIVASGQSGEMVAKLDEKNIKEGFQGYYKNDAATQKKILRDVKTKGDAYFRSGDLLRSNDDGMRFFVDRIGDTFRWKSENVATSEVAEVIGAHAHVIEANVYGVQLPGHDGRAGCAAIVLDGDATREPDSALLSGLARHAALNLASYAQPLFLRFTPTLEQTGTQKTMKHALREEGVEPAKVAQSKPGDRLYWLRNGNYLPFKQRDWEGLNGGSVRL